MAYNPNEPRDKEGRWTDGTSGQKTGKRLVERHRANSVKNAAKGLPSMSAGRINPLTGKPYQMINTGKRDVSIGAEPGTDAYYANRNANSVKNAAKGLPSMSATPAAKKESGHLKTAPSLFTHTSRAGRPYNSSSPLPKTQHEYPRNPRGHFTGN